jgi:soluble lytic murein transglycosylase-like protein
VPVRTTISLGGRWFAPVVLAALTCAAPAAAAPVDGVCAALARQAERDQGIPPGLVQALALAESGRWHAEQGITRPWPWTVTSGTDSFFLRSKPEALRKVEELRNAGRTNIDVGCMQINLGYHGQAFASLAEALEPASNVAYAAQFLKQLREETRSWARATARYHSAHPQRGQAYRDKVYRFWHQLREERVADRAPIRLAGRPLVAAATTPAPARLITPGRTRAERHAAPGAIPILRGGTAAPRDS